MPTHEVTVSCPVFDSFRVQQVAGMFDVPLEKKCTERFAVELPSLDEKWGVGLIVGPSGSGKSTIAREFYGNELYTGSHWLGEKAVIDCFEDVPLRQVVELFTAVGFSSPPSWVKPYRVLSCGERFRCDLARALSRESRAESLEPELPGSGLSTLSPRPLVVHYPRARCKNPNHTGNTIKLTNGTVIESYGTGQRLRGRRYRASRPSLIVCDDLQNDGHIESAHQRELSRGWFRTALINAGDKRTNIINLATALHRDALAMELDRTPGWRSALFQSIEVWPINMPLWQEWERIYCDAHNERAAAEAREFFEQHRTAMEDGAEVLWPDEEDLYTLMKLRVESGYTAFEREKQNSPVDPERCEWPDGYFGEHIWFDKWPTDLQFKSIALDPSKGHDGKRGDYSAFVVLGVDARGVLYVEADLARRDTACIVADGVDLCRRHQAEAFGVEANQFQELLADQFVAEFAKMGIFSCAPAAIHNMANKQVRIRRLGPYLSQRRMRFLAGSHSTRLLVDQLRDFPCGAHDDGPDALEMALRLAEEMFRGKARDDGLGDRLVSSC